MEITRQQVQQAKAIKVDRSKGSMYNSWRSKVYTIKGKRIGFPQKWNTFAGFKEDMQDGWSKGKILIRKNINAPYSKDNCIWANKGDESLGKLSTITYQGQTKTIAEWCNIFQLNYNGVRQRYFKGKDYTTEEILFGKRISNAKKVLDISQHKDQQKKRNKISKMLSAYRCKDKKRGLVTNITYTYLSDIITNGKCIYCGDNKNIGLDRIDNSRGHEIGNVVPCCYECNVARGNNFTMEEMLVIGKAIKFIKDHRNNEDKISKDSKIADIHDR